MGTSTERPGAAAAITITVRWHEQVLLFQQLKRGEGFTLGEEGCDFAIAHSMLGTVAATLVKIAADGTSQLMLLDSFDDDSDLCCGDERTRLAEWRTESQPGVEAAVVGVAVGRCGVAVADGEADAVGVGVDAG